MKWLLLVFFNVLILVPSLAQELSLVECFDLALQKTPLAGQKELYEELADSKMERIGSAFLPQVSLNGQWSYQSDVFSLPFSPPGTDIPQIPKSQYQATVGIEQHIYDGGMVRQSKEVARQELVVNQQKTDADLYKVKETVAMLYFGILRAQETEKNFETARNTLLERKKEVDAGYNSGILLLSDKASFEKEILAMEQQSIAIKAEKAALAAMLADKLGRPFSPGLQLELPAYDLPGQTTAVSRPEIAYFDQQKTLLNETSKLTATKTLPKLSAFARGGFGSPNPYNFFETDLSGFYIAGVRLYWPIFDWGSNKLERQELIIQENILENSKQDMLQQLENGAIQWQKKWEVSGSIAERDAEIVRLQQSIVDEYNLRLEGGTITSSEYIAAIDQLTRAKTTARMHEIDRAWYEIQYLIITGKL